MKRLLVLSLILLSGCATTPKMYSPCDDGLTVRYGFWAYCPINGKMFCQYCSEAKTPEAKKACASFGPMP